MDIKTKQFLHRQLIHLGDMIADDMSTAEMRRDYRKISRALGLVPVRKKITSEEEVNNNV